MINSMTYELWVGSIGLSTWLIDNLKSTILHMPECVEQHGRRCGGDMKNTNTYNSIKLRNTARMCIFYCVHKSTNSVGFHFLSLIVIPRWWCSAGIPKRSLLIVVIIH